MRVEDAVYLGLGTLLAAIALVLLVAVAVAFERALLGDMNPLFTCNEGLPLNPRNAFYYQTTPDFFGFAPNPFGFGLDRARVRTTSTASQAD